MSVDTQEWFRLLYFQRMGILFSPRENPNVDVTTRFFWRSIWTPEEGDKKKVGGS